MAQRIDPVIDDISRGEDVRPPLQSTATWTPAKSALALTLGLRILYSAVAAWFSPSLLLDPKLILQNSFTESLMQRSDNPVLYAFYGVWERFDTLWYIHIARYGYDMHRSAVFYPLYPALIRLFSFFTHWDLLSALLVTSVATFFFLWGALRLFELHMPREAALRAVLLWAVVPDSFIFFSGYPDSLLLALTVWSLYFAEQRRWRAAGFLGLMAGTAKAFGCLTLLPILYYGWRRRDWRALVSAGMTMLGTAGFQLWLHANGFPSTASIYETFWRTKTSMPWVTVGSALWSLAHGKDVLLAFNLGVVAVTLAAGYLARVPVVYRIYSAGVFCLLATKNTDPVFQSSMRYALAMIAAYPAISMKLQRNFGFACLLLAALMVNLFLLATFLDWGLVV
jgi:hypothetical protein